MHSTLCNVSLLSVLSLKSEISHHHTIHIVIHHTPKSSIIISVTHVILHIIVAIITHAHIELTH